MSSCVGGEPRPGLHDRLDRAAPQWLGPACVALLLVGCRWPAPRWEASADPAVIERGRYVAENVAICITCHSERDWRYYGGPPIEGTEGAGGESFVKLFKFPDDVVLESPNLTPHALGGWTDGEIARAIAGGLSRDGSMLFLMHPQNQYRAMARSDLEAVVAYLRTLPPVASDPPATDLRYPILRDVGWAFVGPWAGPRRPPMPGTVASGAYLANLASCRWCHTKVDRLGFPIPGYDWAGGMGFPVPAPGGGTVVSPNTTFDAETGLGRWTEQTFVSRFRGTTEASVRAAALPPGGFNSPMAWHAYSGMTEQDLSDIYRYLRTLPRRRHATQRWVPPANEG